MRILWINTEPLHPLDKGGKIRTYQMLKRIKLENEVTYVSFAGPGNNEVLERWSEYCHRLVTVPRRERPKTGPKFYRDLILNLASSHRADELLQKRLRCNLLPNRKIRSADRHLDTIAKEGRSTAG